MPGNRGLWLCWCWWMLGWWRWRRNWRFQRRLPWNAIRSHDWCLRLRSRDRDIDKFPSILEFGRQKCCHPNCRCWSHPCRSVWIPSNKLGCCPHSWFDSMDSRLSGRIQTQRRGNSRTGIPQISGPNLSPGARCPTRWSASNEVRTDRSLHK